MKNYTNLFQQFIARTNEKEVIKTELAKLFKNKKLGSLLDIGCGTGETIEKIIPNFEKILLIDIEDRVKEEIKNNDKVKFVKNDFIQYKSSSKFDFILAAYVLWEVPYKKWDAFFKKAKNLLKPNGIMIIIDEYSENKYDNSFFNFNTNLKTCSDYPDLKKYLEKNKFKFNITKFKSQIFAKNELEMYEVLKFFFQSPKQNKFYQKNKQKIINDLKTKCAINLQHIIFEIKNPGIC